MPAMTRRRFLVRSAGAAAALASASSVDAFGFGALGARKAHAAGGWYAPGDTVPHERTWMAWPARRDIWGSLLASAREDVARVARTIARYEPVSIVARPGLAAEAGRACGTGVEAVEIANDDLWMRDMGPIFLLNAHGELAGLDLKFNGWGRKAPHTNDATVARRVLEHLGLPRIVAPFVSEGGALEADGAGTVMATESSIINSNRNPGRSKTRLTAEIRAALGARRVLWLPGLAKHDITDDHIDGLARFVGPARVVVDQPANPRATNAWASTERQALRLLKADRTLQGTPLTCAISRESRTIPPGQNANEFVNDYVNWYLCNGALLIPSFGDHGSDRAAHELVEQLFPGRAVEQLRIDAIATGGGGIHCATQQQPAVAPGH